MKNVTYNEYAVTVHYKGQVPTIVDFISAFLVEPEDEHTGNLSEMWNLYLAGKPLESGNTFVADTRNGHVRFESYYSENNSKSITEMCYWNFADKKYKLVAFNDTYFQNGEPIQTQYSGWSFYLYNNALHKMAGVSGEDLGLEELYDPNNCVGAYPERHLHLGENLQWQPIH